MNIKELIKKFKQEFSLSEDYECELNQDDAAAKHVDVMVPQYEAKETQEKIYHVVGKSNDRVLVIYRPEKAN